MACPGSLSSGLFIGCDPQSSGGLFEIYIALKSSVLGTTESSPDLGIQSFTMDSGALFYKFEFNKDSSDFTEVATKDAATGSTSVVQTVTLYFSKREKTKRDKFVALQKNLLVAITKDANGEYVYLGEVRGLTVTTVNSTSGKVLTDANGYTLTLVGNETKLANTVLASALSASPPIISTI